MNKLNLEQLSNIFPSLSKKYSEELLKWINAYEYEYIVKNKVIFRYDLQLPDEEEVEFTAFEFIDDWIYTLENKYDYSNNSIDRRLCGDEFINITYDLINELKKLRVDTDV